MLSMQTKTLSKVLLTLEWTQFLGNFTSQGTSAKFAGQNEFGGFYICGTTLGLDLCEMPLSAICSFFQVLFSKYPLRRAVRGFCNTQVEKDDYEWAKKNIHDGDALEPFKRVAAGGRHPADVNIVLSIKFNKIDEVFISLMKVIYRVCRKSDLNYENDCDHEIYDSEDIFQGGRDWINDHQAQLFTPIVSAFQKGTLMINDDSRLTKEQRDAVCAERAAAIWKLQVASMKQGSTITAQDVVDIREALLAQCNYMRLLFLQLEARVGELEKEKMDCD